MKKLGIDKKIIVFLFILAVFCFTIAFSTFSNVFKVKTNANLDSAKWDIRFANPTLVAEKGDGKQLAKPLVENDINLTLKIGLTKPNDEVKYIVYIENNGDIDAKIQSIEIPDLGEYESKIISFVASYDDGGPVIENEILKAKEKKLVYISIKFKDITDFNIVSKEVSNIPLTFKINYTQAERSSESEEENPIIPVTSPFIVTEDGTLIHYIRQGSEISVSVPAEVGGIQIKKIGALPFVKADFMIVNDWESIIIINKEYDKEIKEFASDEGIETVVYIEQFGSGNDPFEITQMDADTKFSITEDGQMIESIEQLVDNYLINVDLSNMIYLEEIGMAAFYGDSSYHGLLESVVFPQTGNLKYIRQYSFVGNKLKTINLPEGLMFIEADVFYKNNLSGNLVIPSTVVTIGGNAFAHNNLTSVTVLGDSDRYDGIWSNIFQKDLISLPRVD